MPESKRRRNRGRRGRDTAEEVSNSPLNGADPLDFKDLEEDNSLSTGYKSVMFGLMILGLLWIVVWYITSGAWPIPAAGNGNIFIGFGLAMVGFLMTMRWQ